MALLKCTECGHEVSDRASACPNCGCPIEKGKCCVECGQPILEGVNECPNCGCPTQDKFTHDIESPKKSKNCLLWLISILALAVLLGCGYYFYNKTNGTLIEQVHPYEERETITDNGSNNTSENPNNPNKEGYSEYTGKFRINGPHEIRQIITLREDRSVLLEVHYDFSNSDYKYKGVWRPYHSHYGDMICLEFTSNASLHIGRGWNPQKTIYYICDMKIAMDYNDIPAHDEDAYSTITRI